MMVRDHFGQCPAIPEEKKKRFVELKGQTSPSSSLSRQYWMYAAERIGMINTDFGIIITPQTQAAAMRAPLFGTNDPSSGGGGGKLKTNSAEESILKPSDKVVLSPFLFTLLSEVQKVYLLPSEQVGKRKSSPLGLMGFGCRYCSAAGRLGFCRVFPLNKRSMSTKVEDIYKHMKRCTLCPKDVKAKIVATYEKEYGSEAASGKKPLNLVDTDRDFMDQLWKRLGREGDAVGSS